MSRNMEGYSLCLKDGNNWRIDSDEFNMTLVNTLASIMRLRESKLNGIPKLIYSRIKEDGALTDNAILTPYSTFKDESWKCHNAKSKSLRLWRHPFIDDVLCEVANEDEDDFKYTVLWYSLLAIYNRSIGLEGLPFHAGLAELNGQGVLFSASGGTGKSTTCRRLPDYWKPLCDDETLVVLDINKEYRAHPFPTWSDYLMKRAPNTWDVQYSVPVSAIFFLERADNNEVTALTASEASVLMMESASQVCVHNKTLYRQQPDLAEFRKKLFNNACNLAMKIPAFWLSISLNGKFWEEVEKVLICKGEAFSCL